MPSRRPAAAGLPVREEPAPQQNPAIFRYAKAVVAYLVTQVASLTTWSVLIGTGPIGRTGWIALGGAIATPLAAALGVAVTTNADPTPNPAPAEGD